jgi:hypothetical protein
MTRFADPATLTHKQRLRQESNQRARARRLERAGLAPSTPAPANVSPHIDRMTASTRERCACNRAWADHRSIRHEPPKREWSNVKAAV